MRTPFLRAVLKTFHSLPWIAVITKLCWIVILNRLLVDAYSSTPSFPKFTIHHRMWIRQGPTGKQLKSGTHSWVLFPFFLQYLKSLWGICGLISIPLHYMSSTRKLELWRVWFIAMNRAADVALSLQQSALLPCQLVAAANMAILHVSPYSSLRCELAHPDNAVKMLVTIGLGFLLSLLCLQSFLLDWGWNKRWNLKRGKHQIQRIMKEWIGCKILFMPIAKLQVNETP